MNDKNDDLNKRLELLTELIGNIEAEKVTNIIGGIMIQVFLYPHITQHSINRLKKAGAEFMLAINEAYEVDLQEGVTEEIAIQKINEQFDKIPICPIVKRNRETDVFDEFITEKEI